MTTTYQNREIRTVPLEGGDTCIRSLSAREYYGIWRKRIDEQNLTDFEAATLLVLLCTCWGDGTPVYDPDNPEHLAEVAEWDFVAFETVLAAARDLCGLKKRAAEDVEKK